MIYFCLPDFYENFKINQFLIKASSIWQDKFKTPIHISLMSGSFPFSTWNGGFNNNKGIHSMFSQDASLEVFPLYYDYDCYKYSDVPFRLNCSNVCLEDFDFLDEHMNVILKLNENGCNEIEVSNLNLLGYIMEKYPEYTFVFSDNADLIKPVNLEMINTLTSFDQLSCVKLPFRLNQDVELLKQLENKHKIELVVNTLCPVNCPSFEQCHIQEDETQLAYQSNGPIELCDKNNNYAWNANFTLSLDEIKSTYEPMGFQKYSFMNIPSNVIFNKILFYFNYFFKPEYISEMLWKFNSETGVLI